jgi:hypothetical protein
MSDNTLVNDMATDAADVNTENQAPATKTYTQDEVDNMMARMKGSLEKKLLKPYAELGDPEELRQLKADAESKRQAEQLKRGEFERTLQEMAAKKDQEIQKRDAKIREYQINTPLLSAAAQFRAVNAEQVKALLSNQVRLNQDGEVEVVDAKGSVRYSDSGEPLGVSDLVREFLDSNPHFVAAPPSTTNSRSNVADRPAGKIDISKLDMKNPEHRKLYAEAQRAKA